MAARGGTRIQLCGRLVAEIAGQRVEEALPGRQGRVLFVYLAVNRRRPCQRDELIAAVWPDGAPAAADAALNSLLAKTRTALGKEIVAGRHDVWLHLPNDAWIDLEAATEGLHRAESAVALGEWTRAWGPARVALHIAQRRFLPGHDAGWIDEIRVSVEDVLQRAHECVAAVGLGLRGPELASADRSARALIRRAPYRESGYRLLMEVLAVRGNFAEALLTYERLRNRLRQDLGASPSPETRAVHARLLQGQAPGGPTP